jgi:predicted SprT family Zn-dependent metalloprotease
MDLTDAEELANLLIARHGLDSKGWTFKWSRAKEFFGSCDYANKTIKLSKYLAELNGYDDVKDTILHEIAHALAGPRAYHGYIWKQTAIRVGANPSRCYLPHVVTPPTRFLGVCPECGRTIRAHRRNNVACNKCCQTHNGNKYHIDYKILWYDLHKVSVTVDGTTYERMAVDGRGTR